MRLLGAKSPTAPPSPIYTLCIYTYIYRSQLATFVTFIYAQANEIALGKRWQQIRLTHAAAWAESSERHKTYASSPDRPETHTHTNQSRNSETRIPKSHIDARSFGAAGGAGGATHSSSSGVSCQELCPRPKRATFSHIMLLQTMF